jgi:hypothetical protein
VFTGGPAGAIMAIDSDGGDNCSQWFNSITGDDLGNTYAVGANDAGPQYVWAFNPDGSVKWKESLDYINGYNLTPCTVHWKDGFVTVGFKYYDNSNNTQEFGFVRLYDSTGEVQTYWVVTSSTPGNKVVFDSDVLPNGDPVAVGYLSGEYTTIGNISPVTAQSSTDVLVVPNSYFTTVPDPWNTYQFQVQTDPNNNNSCTSN